MKNIIIAFVISLIVGCGPKVQYPFLGVDVNAHWFHEAKTDADEAKSLTNIQNYVKSANFSTLRVGVFWDWPVEHMPAAYKWAKETGAPEIILDVYPAPPNRGNIAWWVPWRDNYQETSAQWRAFAKKIVREFPDVYWMIGNEPNRQPDFGGDPMLWGHIYKIFYEEAHEAGVRVIGPGLGHSVAKIKNTDWLRQFFLSGGKVDVVGVHPYDRGLRMMIGVRMVMRELGLELEVWAVETSGAPNQTPSDHAGYLQKIGYTRVIYHVLGGWRPDRRAKGIDDLILLEREGTSITLSRDAMLLKLLGCKMKGE